MTNHERNPASGNDIEKLPGCPLCEHSDPQLERELHAFAQLLFDIWLARQEEKESRAQNANVDKGL